MKRRLNVICALVVLMFVVELCYDIIDASKSFAEGYKEGMQHSETGSTKGVADVSFPYDSYLVEFSSHKSGSKESILNAKTKKTVPFEPISGSISILNTNPLYSFFATIFRLVLIVFYVIAVVLFFKFIRNINKNVIFDLMNVCILRWMGVCFVCVFFSNILSSLIDYYGLNQCFSSMNLDLHPYHLLATTEILLGLTAFIVAEIFSIGIKMREEQEFTV